MARIVCISDTHTHHRRFDLPAGDVLIHAGDLTTTGKIQQVGAALDWLHKQPHAQKIVVAGNHDWCFLWHKSLMVDECTRRGLLYLEDQGAEVMGLKVWGSPYTPEFAGWAFMEERGEMMRRHWDRIPRGLDILVTHGPPRGILDKTTSGEHVGCEELRLAVEETQPRLHVFGHIHEAAGEVCVGERKFVNAAQRVFVIDL